MVERNKREIYENWVNGNRRWVRNYMRTKDKKYICDFIYFLINEMNVPFNFAIMETYKMCEY